MISYLFPDQKASVAIFYYRIGGLGIEDGSQRDIDRGHGEDIVGSRRNDATVCIPPSEEGIAGFRRSHEINRCAFLYCCSRGDIIPSGSMGSYQAMIAGREIHPRGSGRQSTTRLPNGADTGQFTINNAEYLSDNPDENYYGNFTFAGDERYHGCVYEGNVTVVSK